MFWAQLVRQKEFDLGEPLEAVLRTDSELQAAIDQHKQSRGVTPNSEKRKLQRAEAAGSGSQAAPFILIDRTGRALENSLGLEIKQMHAKNQLGAGVSVRVANTPLIVPIAEFLSPQFSLDALLSYSRRPLAQPRVSLNILNIVMHKIMYLLGFVFVLGLVGVFRE